MVNNYFQTPLKYKRAPLDLCQGCHCTSSPLRIWLLYIDHNAVPHVQGVWNLDWSTFDFWIISNYKVFCSASTHFKLKPDFTIWGEQLEFYFSVWRRRIEFHSKKVSQKEKEKEVHSKKIKLQLLDWYFFVWQNWKLELQVVVKFQRF